MRSDSLGLASSERVHQRHSVALVLGKPPPPVVALDHVVLSLPLEEAMLLQRHQLQARTENGGDDLADSVVPRIGLSPDCRCRQAAKRDHETLGNRRLSRPDFDLDARAHR